MGDLVCPSPGTSGFFMQPVWPLTFETYVKGDEETGHDQVKDKDKDKDSDKNKRNERLLSTAVTKGLFKKSIF